MTSSSALVAQADAWLHPPVLEARNAPAASFDTARGRIVLYGGLTQAGEAETWEHDGVRWLRRDSSPSPSDNLNQAMAYDATRRRVVFTPRRFSVFETWEWDGDQWAQRATLGPSPRNAHAMVYDPTRQRVVLFGGNASTRLNDTWLWDGSAWTQRTPATSPPARSQHALAWDDVNQRVILFGGVGGQTLGDTWSRDGTNWTQLAATGPLARRGLHMATDTVRHRIVMFGGRSIAAALCDVWEWDGSALLPCALYVDLGGPTILVPTVNTAGSFAASLPIPNDGSLTGLRLNAQPFALPGDLPRGYDLGNAVSWHLGL